ncbi:MAG: 4Fe-4S binding protein [Candidatus Poseidoniaceae archaeon]|jgi:NAD-dependent dihydropyrimidine dehydrogenase PreA subunit|nr:4Fe-4S binding protein [Candidatus Poseidoniaceae archaeon]
MTSKEDLANRRAIEAERIAISLARQKGEMRSEIKGGDETVAWVTEDLCIGCDQCTIVCDDNAIELYSKEMKSPLLDVPSNRKARILKDECTGCRLCVLACPTDAIKMIDR